MPQPVAERAIAYVDSHAHLDRYGDPKVADMLERATRAGVRRVLTVGADAASSARAIALARRHEGMLAAAGLHPLRVDEATARREVRAVEGLVAAALDRLVAIGEVGLDESRAAGLPAQITALEAQLELAARARLPVIVHSACGHGRMAEMLRAWRDRLTAVVIHYFVGDEAALRGFLELGCIVSFGRPLLKPEHAELRRLVTLVPAAQLLAETDSYPLPGRSTEPRDVVEVVERLAELRGVPGSRVAAAMLDLFDATFTRRRV